MKTQNQTKRTTAIKEEILFLHKGRRCLVEPVSLIFILFITFFTLSVSAQNRPFQNGEQLNYDIHYKYGIVMLKAGYAYYRVNDSKYEHRPMVNTQLNFKTSSFFDKMYKIRDTLNSYMTEDLKPKYHVRSVNEGNTQFIEELFIKQKNTFSEAHVKRKSGDVIKFDTLLTSENLGYDILSIFVFARTLDYSAMQTGQFFPLTTFIGKRKVHILVRFMGQSVLEKGETLKYKAFRLEVDIVDEVFNESKNAIEMWVSDDENHVPLKIKAKLKIGAAEATLSSHKHLKYPFSSEIKIKIR